MSELLLTANQHKILDFIREYIKEYNLSPTIREICLGTGVKSTSTVHENLKILTDKGILVYTPGTRRSITLTENQTATTGIPIPVVGNVAAGTPILAIDNIQEYYTLPSALVHSNVPGEVFMLCIKGDSMIEIGMFEKDLIIVDTTASVMNGDIAVVRVHGDSVTVKRFYREKDRIRLQPENSSMQPIYANFAEVQIVGKVTGLIRCY